MLWRTYYSQNYASIICQCLTRGSEFDFTHTLLVSTSLFTLMSPIARIQLEAANRKCCRIENLYVKICTLFAQPLKSPCLDVKSSRVITNNGGGIRQVFTRISQKVAEDAAGQNGVTYYNSCYRICANKQVIIIIIILHIHYRGIIVVPHSLFSAT